MVIRVGIIGFSEGNGHPLSFSAIINGYDDGAFAKAGWPVILNYLRQQPATNFGIDDVQITHAWSQDHRFTQKLCDACFIKKPCNNFSEMAGEIDALIIARDDWESHADLALPFLLRGIPVFIDKPLTLDSKELMKFYPYLEKAKLMSCSGMRYARELDGMRASKRDLDATKLVAGVVLNDLERYGIHLIESIASFGGNFSRPVAITRLQANHDSFLLHLENGVPFHLDCLGQTSKIFHLSIFGEYSHHYYDLHDNFNAFRRTLENFFLMVKSNTAPIDPSETRRMIEVLIAAKKLAPGNTAEIPN